MYNFSELFNDFIDERINDSLVNIKKDKQYKKNYKKYEKSLNTLKTSINKSQQEDLENIINLYNLISSYELITTYKIGFIDGINLEKNMNN